MNRAIQAVASTLLLLFVALLGGTVALAAERTVTAPALQEG